jgi:hypothetical protein
VLVLAAAIIALLHSGSSSSSTASPPALAPTVDFAGAALTSGRSVALRWKKMPGARYRLQIAAFPVPPLGGSPNFGNAGTVTTSSASYMFRVLGRQTYFWRVQAFLHSRWQPYTPAQHFLVGPPLIGVSVPLVPRNGSILTSARQLFCWSHVAGAHDYILLVDGRRRAKPRRTCLTLTLSPGAHHWSVRARVKGVRVYKGKRSAVHYFTILLSLPHHAENHFRASH